MESPNAGRACAAWRTNAASRLTPKLIFPDLTITAWRAAARIFAPSSAEKPVVPGTGTVPGARLGQGEPGIAPAPEPPRQREPVGLGYGAQKRLAHAAFGARNDDRDA